MKKILSLILIFALVLTLAGCKKKTDPAADIIGTWEAQIDLSAYLKEKIVSANEELKETLALSAYTATVTLVFNEDGTYDRSVEGGFDEAAIATLRTELNAGYTAYYTEFLRKSGLDMTVEEFEKTTGVSLEKKAEQVADAAYLEGIFQDIDRSGTFLAEENVVYIAGFTDVEAKENGHTFSVEDGRLLFSDCTAPTEFEAAFYPLTLTAVKE